MEWASCPPHCPLAEPYHVARLHLRGLLAPMRFQPLLAALLRHGADAQVAEHGWLLDVPRHRHDDAGCFARLVRLADEGVAQVVDGVTRLATEREPGGPTC